MPIRFNPDKEINAAVINKFLMHCIRGEGNQHWPWSGYQNKFEYGEIQIKGEHFLAHRVSWLYFNNLRKIDKFVLHKPECNTSWCVNPNHLYLGTQQDNIQNQIQLGTFKGFSASGSNHYAALFNDEQISDIRRKRVYTSCRQLAVEYNTTHQTISDICNYKIYKKPTPIKIEPKIITPIFSIINDPNIIIDINRYITSTVIEHFLKYFKNINKLNNGCWIWKHSLNDKGYGVFQINMIKFSAHRISCLYHNNMFQSELSALHKPLICTNKSCVNPDHLYLGTYKNNSHDRIKTGTQRNPIMLGTDHPSAFLNDEIVTKIRFEKAAFNFTCKELGKKYHVSPQLISDICTYKAWKHVP